MESSDLLDNLVPSNQVEESMMREVSLVRELSQAADRNMHNWYAEYAQLMKDYKAEFDADVACSNPEYLQAKLDIIKLAVAKVSSQHAFTLYCKTLPVDSEVLSKNDMFDNFGACEICISLKRG